MFLRSVLVSVLCLAAAGCSGGGNEAHQPTDSALDDLQRPTVETIGSAGHEAGGWLLLTDWGLWARQNGRTLFRISVNGLAISPFEVDQCVLATYGGVCGPAVDSVFTGEFSDTNPVSGSAIWEGKARAVVVETAFPEGQSSHEGRSLLMADLTGARIDVHITGIGEPMIWQDLRMHAGHFLQDAPMYMHGAFFGEHHQGVAGEFAATERNLVGVFGALRQ